jgi:DNA-binding MarR family transcriptional regulator
MDESQRAEIASRLHSAAIHLLRRARQDDPEFGRTPAGASALSVLVFGGPRSLGELAAAEQVTAPTMSRLVSRLEADGWVKRESAGADARVVTVRATAKGTKALHGGRQRRVDHVRGLLDGLSEADWKRVEAAVGLVERALSADGSSARSA